MDELVEHSWEEIYERHVDVLYRICFIYTKNKYDAEDMVQNTFVRLLRTPISFESHEHERAWLIRTASNLCKDHHKHWWQKTVALDIVEHGDMSAATTTVTGVTGDIDAIDAADATDDEILSRILRLPTLHRISLQYYYYDGYSTAEIATILGKKESTVRSYLHRARKALKLLLENKGNEP